MHNIKRLIAYYRQPGNGFRLICVLAITVLFGYTLYREVSNVFGSSPSLPTPYIDPPLLSRFLNTLPPVFLFVGGVVLYCLCYERSDQNAPLRIRILEMLPAYLLGIAYIFMLIAY